MPAGQALVVGVILAAVLATRSLRGAAWPAFIVGATFILLVAP